MECRKAAFHLALSFCHRTLATAAKRQTHRLTTIYFHLNAIFPGNLGYSSSSTRAVTEPSGISDKGFLWASPQCERTERHIKRDLILTLSTARLLMEQASLPLCRLSKANT